MARVAKRHEVQFTSQEVQLAEALRQLVIRQGRLTLTSHCKKAMRQDGGEASDLVGSLKNGRVIEISERYGHYRIVTRWERNGTAHCGVFQDDGVAITYWKNRASDSHRTLNLDVYSQAAFA